MDAEAIGILTGLIVAFTALINSIISSKKLKGDLADTLTNAANNLIDKLENRINILENKTEKQQKEIESQEKKISKLERQLKRLFEGAMKLYHQVFENGLTPVFNPQDIEDKEEDI